MDEYKTLDDILLFLKSHSSKSYETLLMIISELDSPLKIVHNQDIYTGLQKLVKDGYAVKETYRNNTGAKLRLENLYSITYDGKIFINKGGYLERERSHKVSIQNINDAVVNPNQKNRYLSLGFWANVATIIGLIIVIAYLIPENTPYLGLLWWKGFLGL